MNGPNCAYKLFPIQYYSVHSFYHLFRCRLSPSFSFPSLSPLSSFSSSTLFFDVVLLLVSFLIVASLFPLQQFPFVTSTDTYTFSSICSSHSRIVPFLEFGSLRRSVILSAVDRKVPFHTRSIRSRWQQYQSLRPGLHGHGKV